MRNLLLGGLAALAVTIPAAQPATADPAVPEFDFADCPALPAGADPAQWRCEVLIADGTLDFGAVRGLAVGPMRLTFAEGRLDGEYAQVFGALRDTPQPLPGGSTKVEYAGFADFHGDGEVHLKLALDGWSLPRDCAVGGDDDPIRFRPERGEPEDIPGDPPARLVTMTDVEFATPGTTGCGRHGPTVDRALGLPSPAGANSLTLTTYVAIKGYPDLNASATPGS